MAQINEIGLDKETNVTHRLEKVLASIDSKYEILVYSKAFSSYFESDTIRYYKLTDVVHEAEYAEFKDYLDHSEQQTEAKIFRVKKNTGEHRINIVKIRSVKVINENLKYTDIEFIDIEDTVNINDRTMSDFAKIRRLLSITDEYFFTYKRETNIFTLYHYDEVKKIIVYNMDIDEWGELMLSEGIVPEEERKTLLALISDIKVYPQTFTAKLNCGIRTNSNATETVRFTGMLYTCEYETLIIGRVLAGSNANHMGMSVEMYDELQYDSLTGVYNKKAITEYAMKKIKEDKRNRTTIVILDVDHFKSVNDTYGHLYGDKVLARVGAKLKDIVGEDGVVGRIGGDEFMVVLSGINDEQMLRSVLRAIRTQVKWEFAEEYSDFLITCSIGAAICPNNGKEYEELFKKADYCLYIAKEKGRDRYVFFRDDLHRESYEASLNKKTPNSQNNSREVKELKVINTFLKNALVDKDKAIKEVLDHMKTVYKCDNINIYFGDGMENVYTVGEAFGDMKDAKYIFTDEYKAVLGNETYFEMGLVGKVESEMPNFVKEMNARNILSTIQCIIGTPDNIKGLVTFNRCKASAAWANYEVDCANIFASFLSMLVADK